MARYKLTARVRKYLKVVYGWSAPRDARYVELSFRIPVKWGQVEGEK